jgi:hypothetical protein
MFDDERTIFTEQFRLFMYDDLKGIRHVFKVPICYFEDLTDFGFAFINKDYYEVEDLMLDTKEKLNASAILHIVQTGKQL